MNLFDQQLRRAAPDETVDALRWEVADRRPVGEWELMKAGADGEAYRFLLAPMTLIWSVALEADGLPWIHVSMSHHKRLVMYNELMRAKAWIYGPDRWAYQVHPPTTEHVNLAEVLHLFGRLDGQPSLPDFTGAFPDGRKTI